MLQLSREERIANAKKKLQEFRANQKSCKNSAENCITGENSDVICAKSTSRISCVGADSSNNGFIEISAVPVTSAAQETDISKLQLISFKPDISNRLQRSSSTSQTAKNILNSSKSKDATSLGCLDVPDYSRDHQNIEPFGPSFTNGLTTAAIEKAAQISQEITHMLHLNFNYAQSNRSQTPSEATATPFISSEEGNGPYVGISNSCETLRTTSHLSLPNSWQGNARDSPSASSALIRELQHRNIELAALVEQANERHDRSVATVASLRNQLHRLRLSTEEEKRNLEVSTQRELAKARDQIRAHSQTVGALVAAKTELEARLTHLERAAETRAQEIQSLTAARNEANAKLRECEDALQLAKSSAAHSETAKTEALRQLEQWRVEANREKDFRKRLETEIRNREEVLVRLETDMKRLALTNEGLDRQLEVSMAFSKSGPTPKPGTPAAIASTVPCSQCDSFKTRIDELETTQVNTYAEKARLESQYKAYVVDMEMQVTNLRSQLEKSSSKAEKLQQNLEDLQRKLTVKESELTEIVCEVELLRTKQAKQRASLEDANEALIGKMKPTPTEKPPLTLAEVKESVYYKDLELTNGALARKVNELSGRLSEVFEELSLANARLADREAVLTTATSERTALSRAMEQNASLKDQLTRLQDALDIAKKANKEAELELAELRSKKSEGIIATPTIAQVFDSNLQTVPAPMSDVGKRRIEMELEAERVAASEAHLKVTELEAKIASIQPPSKTSNSEDLIKEICELRGLSERQAARIKDLEESKNKVSSTNDKALSEANVMIAGLEAQIEKLQNISDSDVEELKRQLADLRGLSERQAQHIVAMETTHADQLTEKEKVLNEASLQIAELESQIEQLGQKSAKDHDLNELIVNKEKALKDALNRISELEGQINCTHTDLAELEKQLAEITALSKHQAEQIISFESLQNSPSFEKLRDLEVAQANIAVLEAQIESLQRSSGHDVGVTTDVRGRDVETSAVCQTEFSLVKSEEVLSQLRKDFAQSKADYAQLEERFKQIVDRLSASDEEKSRLEGVVAQLEMESSTIDEYITMFAHRRQFLLKRAKIRDALLARLVRDRQELRQRLQSLSETAKAMIASSSQETEELSPSMVDFEKALTSFLSDLDTSAIELDPEIRDSEDEDMDGEGEKGGLIRDMRKMVEIDHTGSPTTLDDRLRQYVSAVHDCPHCECCSGSLLIV